MSIRHADSEERGRARDCQPLASLDEATRSLLDVDPEGVLVLDSAGRCLFANQVALATLGFAADALLGHSLDPLIRPASAAAPGAATIPVHLAELARALASGRPFFASQAIYHRQDGSPVAVEARAFALPSGNHLPHVLLRFRPVPQHTPPGLDNAELGWRQALASIAEGVVILDPGGVVSFINAAAEDILGVRRDQIVGAHIVTFPWDSRDRHGRPVDLDELPHRVALRTGEPVIDREIDIAGNGRRIPLLVSAFPTCDEHGAPSGVITTFRDITARREAELSAARYQSATEAILNSGPFPLLLLDRTGRVVIFNQAAERLARRLRGAGIERGQPVERYLPIAGERLARRIEHAVAGRASRVDEQLPLDDDFRWSELRFDPVTNPVGPEPRVCLSITPLGERRRAAARLRILAQAGALLASSLDYEQTLANLPRLAVPDLADLCMVTALEPDGTLAQIGVCHVNPERQQVAEELARDYPVNLDLPVGIAQVIRSGEPILLPQTPPDFAQDITLDARHSRLMAALGTRSYLSVPMIAHGVTFGALAFAISESARRFDEADLAVAQELARRAALALAQARLYRAAREASREKDEILALLDTVLASAPVGFALLDTELRPVRVNDALAVLCGASAETLLNRPLTEILPDFATLMIDAAAQVLTAGEPIVDLELGGDPRRAGDHVYWRCGLFPVLVDGAVLGVGVVVIDMSDEQRATEERIRLLEREQAARAEAELGAGMIERIQAVSDAALAHLNLDDLLEEILHRVCDLMSVEEATILLLDESRDLLVVRAARGLAVPADLRRGVKLGEGFVGRIAVERKSIVVERVTAEEVPHPFLIERLASMMGVPLVLEDRVIGVLHVGSTTPRIFRPSELRLLQFAADRIAIAIDRASLYEAERRAQRRLAFLAEASGVLSSTLDVERALVQVTELAVPEIADVCTINLIDEDGTFQRLSVAHHNPALDHLARNSVGRFPIDVQDDRITAMRVFRSGESMLFPEIEPRDLAGIIGSQQQVDLLGEVRFRSGMMVPLVAAGRAIGMMGFWLTGDDRRYTPSDVALAEDLARRAAEALERARLYRETVEAVRAREEFLSIASHELKTPLTTVKGYVQILERQLRRPEPDIERLRQATHNLQGQLERFQSLVNDLLDMTQIQRGQLELRSTRIDLSALAREVLDRFEVAPERRPGHKLVLEAPEPVVGEWDPSRLDQVLTNLISNALKYSPEGGEVRVAVRRRGGTAELLVADEGIGISEEEHRSLFQPFSRGVEATRTASGAGLGLHITAQIVRRHGGTIEVDSDPGGGSRFFVRLPVGE